jgi:hypothetical protein
MYRPIFLFILLSGLVLSCAKSDINYKAGTLRVFNNTESIYAVFVKEVDEPDAMERYAGTMPRKAAILVPLLANTSYQIKITDVNNQSGKKIEQKVRLKNGEKLEIDFEGFN